MDVKECRSPHNIDGGYILFNRILFPRDRVSLDLEVETFHLMVFHDVSAVSAVSAGMPSCFSRTKTVIFSETCLHLRNEWMA